jgi:hypothetical protein
MRRIERPGIRASVGYRLGLAAWLLAAPAGAAGAQSVERQRAVVDSLEDVVARFEVRAARLDSLALAARQVDTVTVGGFTIVTDSARSSRLRAAADSAWAIARGELGLSPDAFQGRTIFVRFARVETTWADLMRPGDQVVDRDRSDHALRQRFLAAAGSMAADLAGRRAARWTGAAMSLHADRERLRRRSFVEMVTAATPAGQACHRGDLASCATALGIDAPGSFFPENGSAVLRTAARLGGAGAFDRFVADTSLPLARRLEAAAGVPLDTVLQAWWSDARGIARPRDRVPARTQWVTLFWTLAFAGMALRISRWR